MTTLSSATALRRYDSEPVIPYCLKRRRLIELREYVKGDGAMRRILVIAAWTMAVPHLVFDQAKPNYSGTWKLQSTQVTEILKIEHREPKIHIIYDIEDDQGKRTLDLNVMTDGKEQRQEVQGLPATLIARWEGDALIFEIQRQAPFGLVHVRRTMRLSKDGKVITADRTNFSPNGDETARLT